MFWRVYSTHPVWYIICLEVRAHSGEKFLGSVVTQHQVQLTAVTM